MKQSALERKHKRLQIHHFPRALHVEIVKEQQYENTPFMVSQPIRTTKQLSPGLREGECNKEKERNSLNLLMNNVKSS